VVKLIDVYPDENGREPKMGGYQLMVSADICGAANRDSFSNPKPIPKDQKQHSASPCRPRTTCSFPDTAIMVQVQSSWFPLYDRNPQSYVDNIFFAKPAITNRRRSRSLTAELRQASSICRWCRPPNSCS